MAGQALQTDQLQVLLGENRRLKHAVEELSILNELARAIGASLDPQEIIGTIVRKSLRAVNAEQGVIHLVDIHASDPMKTLVREMSSSHEHEHFRINQTLVGWMQLNRKPLLMNSPRTDPRFSGMKWDESIRSLLCVPLMIKSELKGVLTVYNKKDGLQFTDDDQRLLAIIAAQSGQVIENARLNEREKQLVKMQEELRLAARIQIELLPKSAPAVAGYDIAGKSIPAQSVGGDYFDFIQIDEHRLAFCLGDVSGKGLPASLLMSNVQATLRSHALMGLTAQECTSRSNRLLFQSTSAEKFVTLFYGILDLRDHTLLYANAGHEHPIIVSAKRAVLRLSTGGIMLGMLEEFPFQNDTVALNPGDIMVVFSDGVTEAMNADQAQFGDERLQEVIMSHEDESASVLIESIVDAIRSYVGATPQMDDITLMVVKRNRG
jgi:phosphoserine phosphatase RsbU/P